MSTKEEDVQAMAEKNYVTLTGKTEIGHFAIPAGASRVITVFPQEGVEISDGFHTMSDLYEHRHALFMALCRVLHKGSNYVWKSRRHSDGSPMYPGWFIAGIDYRKGHQITYHLPEKYWDEFKHEEVQVPPLYDGHTGDDILKRLKDFF